MTTDNAELRISKDESERISILKVWLTVMVIFIHLENEINFTGGTATAGIPVWLDTLEFMISRAVSRCAVPFFFFLSAYLLYRKPFSWKQNILKKVRSLVIPYLILNTFWILVFFAGQRIPQLSSFFSRQETNVAGWKFTDWIGAYLGSPVNDWCPLLYPLWFVRNLFLLNLTAPVFQWLVKKTGFWIPAVLIAAWLLTENNNLLLSVCFWAAGCYFGSRKIPISILDRCRKISLVYPVLIVLVCLLRSRLGEIGPRIVYHLCLLTGMFFWYTWMTKIKGNPCRTVLLFISRYSFCIYLFHEMNLTILRKILVKYLPQTTFFAVVQYFVPAAAVLAGCILLSRLLEKTIPGLYRIVSGGRNR